MECIAQASKTPEFQACTSEIQTTRSPKTGIHPGTTLSLLTSHAHNGFESYRQLPQSCWFGRRIMSLLSDGPRVNANSAHLACTINLAPNCAVIDTAIGVHHTNSSYSSDELTWLFVLHDFDVRLNRRTCMKQYDPKLFEIPSTSVANFLQHLHINLA